MGDLLPKSPHEFHEELPIGLRIALMQFVISEIRQDFSNNLEAIIDEFRRNNPRLSNLDALNLAGGQINKITSPYTEFIKTHQTKLSTTLTNAMDLEKNSEIEAAIVLYQQLAKDGFTPSLPYDRLRIIFTRQHRYQDAIDICKRYIEVLETYDKFDHNFSNIHLIPSYQKDISKLFSKIK